MAGRRWRDTWPTPVSQSARPRRRGARQAARPCSVDHHALAARRTESVGDVRPASRHAHRRAAPSAIASAVKDVQLATGLERTAEEMGSISLIRSMVSKEGDHERGTYAMKTGFRPDPTVIHPSIGAIAVTNCRLAGCDIPRHISILPGQWPARGGFLGDQYDAFRTGDPADPVPDTSSLMPDASAKRNDSKTSTWWRALSLRGRRRRAEATMHRETVAGGVKMMSSEQLKAFDVIERAVGPCERAYGETPFGRGCLAARRLIEVGVRCVEVTLTGWDTHVNNHKTVHELLKTLDPAFSTLIRDLRERGLLERTVVLCGGEFGRTPAINPLGGRDHWPMGFSVALAGGGIRGGQVIGETDPEGKPQPTQPVTVPDLHATILTAVASIPRS